MKSKPKYLITGITVKEQMRRAEKILKEIVIPQCERYEDLKRKKRA